MCHAPPSVLSRFGLRILGDQSYAFHGRYRAVALEDVDYYAKILNDGVQGLMRRLNP